MQHLLQLAEEAFPILYTEALPVTNGFSGFALAQHEHLAFVF
jgi:hypothetical protein